MRQRYQDFFEQILLFGLLFFFVACDPYQYTHHAKCEMTSLRRPLILRL